MDNGPCGVGTRDTLIRVRPTPTLRLLPVADYCGEARFTPKALFTHAAEYDSLRWSFAGAIMRTSTDREPGEVFYPGTGTYTINLVGYGKCGTDTATQTFTINTQPEVVMAGRDTVCILDGVYVLDTPTPAGGRWEDAGSRPGVVSPEGYFDPVAAGPGMSVLAYTYAAGGCSVTAYRELVVIERPELRLSSPVLEVCETETYFVLDNGRPTGGWYAGPGVTDPAGVMNPSSLGAGAYTLTYHYRPTGMTCADSINFTVQVRPKPVVQLIGPSEVCQGETTAFAASGTEPMDYVWRYADDPPVRGQAVAFTFATPGFQAIRVTATNGSGCAQTVVQQVRVSAPPAAGFTGKGAQACDDEPYQFVNRSSSVSPETSYRWDFGNGQRSQLENPLPVRFAAGRSDTTYRVTLEVTNTCGTDSYSMLVPVTTPPVAAFSLSDTTGCTALDVSFANQSRGAGLQYAWYIDGEEFSTEAEPPTRTFRAPGSNNRVYHVTLVVTNTCGSSTLHRQITVKPRQLDVRFTPVANRGCTPLEVSFDNTTDPTSGVTYSWDFGDGAVSDAREPVHTFRNTSGEVRTYTVTLTADNGCARERTTRSVTVYPAPDVSFEVPPMSCVGEVVAFQNTSGDVAELRWDFGDGQTEKGTQDPRHVFPGPGTYTVTLTASVPGADCPGSYTQTVTVRELPQATFTLDESAGCAPLDVRATSLAADAGTHLWDFGDGNTAVGSRPGTHTYPLPGEYQVRLTVRDDYGCSRDTALAPVVVHALPEAAFTAKADKACGLPQQVCFTNTTTGGTGYAWDFGNGTTSGINAPCNTYTEAGTYNVRLTATSDFGCTAEAAVPVAIYGAPVAEFSIPDTTGCTAGDMPFTSVSAHTDFIQWTFSDGYTTGEANFARGFDEPGSYDVTVIAGNASGCADTLVANNFVEIYPRPFADFTFDNAEGEIMNTIQFEDQSSTDVIRFGWDFGDGHGSDARDPMHRYLSSFDKTVRHWVENAYGCTDTLAKPIELDLLVGLFIHNIFTPDDNTIAEQNIFKPKGIGLEDFYIGVYSRTGQLVWESDVLDEEGSPTEAWDGTFQGQPAKPGTYVWRVHRARFANDRNWTGMPNERGVVAKTGYITLLR